jgi:hypothetical protein
MQRRSVHYPENFLITLLRTSRMVKSAGKLRFCFAADNTMLQNKAVAELRETFLLYERAAAQS